MASLLSLSLFTVVLLLSSSSSSATSDKHPHPQKPPPATNTPPEILQACKATRFPDLCESSLSGSINVPPNQSPSQILHSAIHVSTTNLKTAESMVKKILDQSAGNLNRTNAAKICLEVLDNSQYRISSADDALTRGKNKDARAWLSAAVVYQYDCWSAIKYVNGTSETNSTMSFLDSLIQITSNALSMVVSYDLFGDKTASWGPPKTERDGFWEGSGSSGDLGSKSGFPSKLTADATVCKDGKNGCYKTVQEAVNAAPDNQLGKKFVVHITAGVYEEIVRIPLTKKNVVFLGDGIGKTVITGSLTVSQPGVTTYATATVVRESPSTATAMTAPSSSKRLRCILFTIIGCLFLFSLIALILFFILRHKNEHFLSPNPPYTSKVPVNEIQLACQATRNPQTCQSSLIQSNVVPPNPTPIQIIQSSLWVSSQNLVVAQSMLQSLLHSAGGDLNLTNVAKSCIEILGFSQYRISVVNDTLPRGRIKDVRAWMSAGLAYQYDCYGGLSYNGGNTRENNETMAFLDTLIDLSSNALSMIVSYDLFGNEMRSWQPPKTERDGFWEASGLNGQDGFKGEFPSNLTADARVCKDGNSSSNCYKTVQEAVNAAPNNTVERRFVIHIKEGVYEEIVRVPFEKKNVVFLGDGMGKTVITGSLSVGQLGVTTYESATVGVLGDGFMATGITFQNTAGAPTHQAVAFRSDSDLSFIENCEFLGNQDTLYAHSLRQYYKSCRIQGNVDFIFGNSAAYFQDCIILVVPRQENPEKGEKNAVTAHGRIDPAQSTGFVFQNCLINGTEAYMALYHSNPKVHKNYLGRPWKDYSRVVFINCHLEALITPEGWLPWNGDAGLKTLYYGEFKNSGPGSDVSKRVNWSSQIPAEHLNSYSVQNFLQGDEWIPTSS